MNGSEEKIRSLKTGLSISEGECDALFVGIGLLLLGLFLFGSFL